MNVIQKVRVKGNPLPLTSLWFVWVDSPTQMFTSLGQICNSSVMELLFLLKISYYVWVPRIMKKLKVSNLLHPFEKLPTVQQPLTKLMDGIMHIMGENWPSAVFILGKYECTILDTF